MTSSDMQEIIESPEFSQLVEAKLKEIVKEDLTPTMVTIVHDRVQSEISDFEASMRRALQKTTEIIRKQFLNIKNSIEI